jgi:hypothetical protein
MSENPASWPPSADAPVVRALPFIGIVHGEPDLAARSQAILRQALGGEPARPIGGTGIYTRRRLSDDRAEARTMGATPDQAGPLIPRPELTLHALREAIARVAPGRLAEMYEKMQAAFVRAGQEDSVVPIHMFYREWAVIVEIERFPETAHRLHAAEQALMNDDARVREAAIREAGEIVRAAHHAVISE